MRLMPEVATFQQTSICLFLVTNGSKGVLGLQSGKKKERKKEKERK
jgi:hypothetical protein